MQTIPSFPVSGASAFHRLFPCLLLLAAFLAGGPDSARAETITIVDDTFADGTRDSQSLPNSLQWYASGASTSLTAQTGSMTLNNTGNYAVAYFTESGSPLSLTSGQTLVLSYTFTLTNPVNSALGFRLGLFNSGGNRISADGATISTVTYRAYTGYGAFTNVAATSGTPMSLTARDKTSTSNNLINSGSAFTTLTSSGVSAFTLEAGTTYTGTFSVTLNLDGTVAITNSITGGTLSGVTMSYTDSTDEFTTFDTVVFDRQTSSFDSMTFTDISLKVVPEPSPLALASAALVGVLAVGLRRRFTV